MSSHAFKKNELIFKFIDQQPVRLNVAVPSSRVVSGEFVISVDGVKGIFRKECSHDHFKFFDIFSALD